MKILIASALALSFTAPSQAEPLTNQTMEMVEFCTVAEQKEFKNQGENLNFGYCLGYIQGHMHYFQVVDALKEGCFRSESYNATYIRKNLIKYVEDHPEKLDQHILLTLLDLTDKLYACPDEGENP